MTMPGFTISLVDDDDGVLKALSRLLRVNGLSIQTFSSPQEFLLQHDPSVPGCAILDVSMPGLDGLELQQKPFELLFAIELVIGVRNIPIFLIRFNVDRPVHAIHPLSDF